MVESTVAILREAESLLEDIDDVKFGEVTPTLNSVLACIRDAIGTLKPETDKPCCKNCRYWTPTDDGQNEFETIMICGSTLSPHNSVPTPADKSCVSFKAK